MPWKVSGVVNERMQLVLRVQQGERVTDLCREYGISRKTAYKFIARYERLGPVGLYDEPRMPERVAHRLAPEVEELIVRARQAHPTWGPRKLRAWLGERHAELKLPAASTFGRVLARRELVVPSRRRRRAAPPTATTQRTMAHESNAVWCCDFKGQFKLGNGRYCYPLTVTDLHSRFLLGCEAMDRIRTSTVQTTFAAIFREYGLPSAILSDNGPPFASRGVLGFSALSVWWLRLGIEHQRIEPGHPEQNGAHERMHLTLKRETTRPAGLNSLQQQERFDRFREVFNEERPHEALGLVPPARKYTASLRTFPEHLPEPQYPMHDLVVRVTADGRLYINRIVVAIGRAFAHELVGLREIEDDRFVVSFLDVELGVVDLNTKTFERAA